jgi:hypothetical protein
MSTAKQLEQAQTDLARIESEQQAKIAAANAAFDKEPTEANAERVSAAERVASLIIGKAKAKVASLEERATTENRAALQVEMEQQKAIVDGAQAELQPFIERGFEFRQALEQHERDLKAFHDRVANASTRAGEIELELSGRTLNAEQRHSFLIRCDAPLSHLRGTYAAEMEGRKLKATQARGVVQPPHVTPQSKSVAKRERVQAQPLDDFFSNPDSDAVVA